MHDVDASHNWHAKDWHWQNDRFGSFQNQKVSQMGETRQLFTSSKRCAKNTSSSRCTWVFLVLVCFMSFWQTLSSEGSRMLHLKRSKFRPNEKQQFFLPIYTKNSPNKYSIILGVTILLRGITTVLNSFSMESMMSEIHFYFMQSSRYTAIRKKRQSNKYSIILGVTVGEIKNQFIDDRKPVLNQRQLKWYNCLQQMI